LSVDLDREEDDDE
jgi:transglutaminase/protease-like cytokinesis protein 3